MNTNVIEQPISIDKAIVLESEALAAIKYPAYKTVDIACFNIRKTKAYKVLGNDSFVEWGFTTLGLKKSRLQELARAGSVRSDLLEKLCDETKEVQAIISNKFINALSIPLLTILAKASQSSRFEVLSVAITTLNELGIKISPSTLKKTIEQLVAISKAKPNNNNLFDLDEQFKRQSNLYETLDKNEAVLKSEQNTSWIELFTVSRIEVAVLVIAITLATLLGN
mgnify:CR=1 FL=1